MAEGAGGVEELVLYQKKSGKYNLNQIIFVTVVAGYMRDRLRALDGRSDEIEFVPSLRP